MNRDEVLELARDYLRPTAALGYLVMRGPDAKDDPQKDPWNPTVSTLLRISHALNVDLGTIVTQADG